MSKNIWLMCAHSESGDHYHAAEIWDHEPSEDEINAVRALLDSCEFDPEFDSKDSECYIVVDGKELMTYILDYTILKRTING